MDEDMSPSSLRKPFGICRDGFVGAVWSVLGLKVMFRSSESFSSRSIVIAIALSLDEVTRWGSFLMREVHISFGFVAY